MWILKFELNNENVYDDVPFIVEGQQFFFSFYEIEIPDKSINLFPNCSDVFVNAALGNEDIDPIFSDDDGGFTRKGIGLSLLKFIMIWKGIACEWNALSRETVLEYLRGLKKEYLSTNNYNETVFKN